MIVNSFYLVCIVLLPAEADAPLVAPTTFQRFQSGARKCGQVSQPSSIVQHTQLPQRPSLHRVIQPPREPAIPEALSLFAGEACNHRPKLRCSPEGVNFTASHSAQRWAARGKGGGPTLGELHRQEGHLREGRGHN